MNPLHLLIRAKRGVSSRARNILFRLLGVRITGYVWLQNISIPRQWGDVTIEGSASLDDGVVLLCSGHAKVNKIWIKRGTYINRNTILDAHEHLEIGENCMIGPGCFITDSDHMLSRGVSVRRAPMHSKPIILEANVWLGAGVIVLKGVRIGCGAVVGAGAVVTRDVPPYEVMTGVPARSLGRGQGQTSE